MATLTGNITESEAVTTWRVTATKCKDGTLSGTTTTTGSSYSITTADTEPCNITLAPKIDYAWSAAKGVTVNDYVVAANPDTTPHIWQATSVTGDTYYTSVSLLLHCDGTNGSTTFTDNSPSPQTVTANGNAQISTSQSKFGGASALFDGTGDYLSIANSGAWDFGAGNATVECWVYLTAGAGTVRRISGFSDSVGATNGWILFVDAANKFAFTIHDGAYKVVTSTTVTSLNIWYHVAGVKIGGTTYIFVDGVLENTLTGIGTATAPNSALGIGRMGAYDGQYLTGYVDDFRITKGVARYTANFTPPTSAFLDYLTATGATEPSWNLSGTTTDNNVTWTYVAPLIDPKTLGPKIPS